MGEAVYYMKVTFKNPEDAESALPKLVELFSEGARAHDWWQGHRGIPREEFWPKFVEQFPQVTEYLKTVTIKNFFSAEQEGVPAFGGDNNNALAGLLSFVETPDDADDWCRNIGTAALTYSAMVWHFADWQPLADFIVKKFDADHASWISDEDVSPFELLT